MVRANPGPTGMGHRSGGKPEQECICNEACIFGYCEPLSRARHVARSDAIPVGLATIVKVSPARWGSTSTSYRPRPFRHRHTAGAEPDSSGHGMQPTVSPVQSVSSPARMRLLSRGNHLSSILRFPCSWAHPNAYSVPSRLGIGVRFTTMPVQLVSVYAEVPIPGVPGTKLVF